MNISEKDQQEKIWENDGKRNLNGFLLPDVRR